MVEEKACAVDERHLLCRRSLGHVYLEGVRERAALRAPQKAHRTWEAWCELEAHGQAAMRSNRCREENTGKQQP